jgi:hypothetical protein
MSFQLARTVVYGSRGQGFNVYDVAVVTQRHDDQPLERRFATTTTSNECTIKYSSTEAGAMRNQAEMVKSEQADVNGRTEKQGQSVWLGVTARLRNGESTK